MAEQSVIGTKVAVVIFDPATKQWLPAKGTTKTLSRIDLYRNTTQATYRIVGYTLEPELVINSAVTIATKYKELTPLFHSFGDANNVMWGFNFAVCGEAPLFKKAVKDAQLAMTPQVEAPEEISINDKNNRRIVSMWFPPPETSTDEKRMSKAFNSEISAGNRKANETPTGEQSNTSLELIAAAQARAKRVLDRVKQEAEISANVKAADEAMSRQEAKEKTETEAKEKEETKEKEGTEGEEAGIKDNEFKYKKAKKEAVKQIKPKPLARMSSLNGASQLTGDLLLLKNEILAEVRVMLQEFAQSTVQK